MVIYFLLILIPFILCGPSHRGKCSLECYSRCMQSGTPSAVYCNCPVEKTFRPCSSIEDKLNNAVSVPIIPSISSDYLDAHTIRIQMADHPGAFAYIFEYSTISTQPDEWYFAGASVIPSITFTILDPCRDYKFRVIVVVRNTDPNEQFAIYRPRQIPVKLPPFVIEISQISVETPIFNATNDMLKIYVRWTLPRGYMDYDIYGYEAPAIYPIQCRTPEEELPQPKIEIVRSGGRLVVSLPSSVLETRCRMWVEVRMLPRCVRLEPFNIQKNIEVDCDKNPELEICNRESNPKCIEAMDVLGGGGQAKIEWKNPIAKNPLYYHVRYGPAQMKGTPPFVSWQLATKRDVKIDGRQNSVVLNVSEDQDYGVQICAILTSHRKRPKFGLVKVTPFQCISCIRNSTLGGGGRCGECGLVEGTTVSNQIWKEAQQKEINQHKKVSSHTVFNMGADLLVAGRQSYNRSFAQTNTKTIADPISIDKAAEINMKSLTQTPEDDDDEVEEVITTTEGITSNTTQLSTSTTTSTTTSTATTTSLTTTQATTTEFKTTTTPEDKTTTMVVEVGVDLHQIPETMISKTVESTKRPETEEEKMKSEESNLIKTTEIYRVELTKELEESVKNLEKALEKDEEERTTKAAILEKSTEKFSTSTTQEIIETTDVTIAEPTDDINDKEIQKKLSSLTSTSSEVRHHEKSKKCLLANGVVCEFGCENRRNCTCNLPSHILSIEGSCILKDSIRHISCLPKKEINATWDPITMNILVRSSEAAEHIRSMKTADKLFVEFGKAKEDEEDNRGFMFEGNDRSRMVVSIEILIRSSIFTIEPFIFHANQSIDIDDNLYGMRLCTFDSKQITNPYEHDWDRDSKANTSANIAQVVQLSPVHFTNDLHSDYVLHTAQSIWDIIFVIGKISLMVLLLAIMIILIYLNCTRIKTFYDRKRTHYFRPYYLDPQIHVTSINRYPGCSNTNPTSDTVPSSTNQREVGYYDSRGRVI